jgi:hypothetical protein
MAVKLERDVEQARGLLRRLLDRLKWSPTELAKRAGVAQPTITRFLGNPTRGTAPARGLGTEAALKIDSALAAAKVESTTRRSFLKALGVSAFGGSGTAAESTTERSPTFEQQLSLDALAAQAVVLARHGLPLQAAPALTYLVDPRDAGVLHQAARTTGAPATRLLAAVASAHLGHVYLNRGAGALAQRFFGQARELLGEVQPPFDRPLRQLWEPWEPLLCMSFDEFRLWCDQMLGSATAMVGRQQSVGKKGYVDRAKGHLLYVATEAQRAVQRPGLRLIYGNTLRDLAQAKVLVEPTSAEAGKHLTDSIALLSDLPDDAMLAMSLLRRAQWRKAGKQWGGMEMDAAGGLVALEETGGVVRCNGLNSLAELYADSDRGLARWFAQKALRVATEGGYERERERAEVLLGS